MKLDNFEMSNAIDGLNAPWYKCILHYLIHSN